MLSKFTHIFMESTKEKALLCRLWLPTCLHHSLVGFRGFLWHLPWFFFLLLFSLGSVKWQDKRVLLKNFSWYLFLLEFIIIPQEPYVFNNFISWKLTMCYRTGLVRPIPPRSAVWILVPPKEKGWESAWIRQQNKLHIGWRPMGMALPE
jgi:hypothetical protein